MNNHQLKDFIVTELTSKKAENIKAGQKTMFYKGVMN
jgi:hypothetical protein